MNRCIEYRTLRRILTRASNVRNHQSKVSVCAFEETQIMSVGSENEILLFACVYRDTIDLTDISQAILMLILY